MSTEHCETIYVWPCGTWCTRDDLNYYLDMMSDDFTYAQVPCDVDLDEIEDIYQFILDQS